MGSVRDIKDLTEAISAATSASVLATEETSELTRNTTRSAREIDEHIHSSLHNTEQVNLAMNEVAKVAQENTAASAQSLSHSQNLFQLSETLQSLVSRISQDPASGKELQ